MSGRSEHIGKGQASEGWSVSATLLLAIGMGFYLGWRTIDISPTLFPEALPSVSEAVTLASYVCTGLTLSMFLAIAAWSVKEGRLLGSAPLVGIAVVGPAAGTALLYVSGWSLPQAWIPGVFAGRLLFCTSAVLLALWGELLCSVKWENVLVSVAGGYAVAFCICLLSAGLDAPGVFVFRAACPLISGAAMLALRHDVAACQSEPDSDNTTPSWHFPIRVFLGIALFGAIFAIANRLSETKTDVSTELYTLYAGVTVSLAILAIGSATKRGQGNFSMLFRLLTPLVVVCLIMTLTLEKGSQHYEAFAIGFAWVFFRIFAWSMWAHIGSRSPEQGAAVFAIGQLFLTVSATLSELFCSTVDLSALPLTGAVSAIILVTVFTSALVMNERSVLPFSSQEESDAPAIPKATEFDPMQITVADVLAATSLSGLSERECEIALLVLQGNDNAAVCKAACITESTLRTHLRNIYGKTDTHSRAQLIDMLKQGIAR